MGKKKKNKSTSNLEESLGMGLLSLSLSETHGTKPKFKFPPPPRLSKSANNSTESALSDTSSASSITTYKIRRRTKSVAKKLPPVGIFWDIENCQVPKNKSAAAIVQRIRDFFLEKYREAEFIVVCDVKKENAQIIQELHDSQVNLIHVSSTSKNAADEKLRQSLRRFAEVHSPPSAIVLISSDINFAGDLSDLRYRKKIRVILVHNTNVTDALILCANEHFSYTAITEGLPTQKKDKASNQEVQLKIHNLPLNIDKRKIKNRLKLLTDNCGGRVVEISDDGTGTIKFSSLDFATRAQRRIQGEDVYGNKIEVLTPTARNFIGRKLKSGDTPYQPNLNGSPFYYNQQRRQDGKIQDNLRPIRGSNNLQVGNFEQNWRSSSNDRLSRSPQNLLEEGACALVPGRIHKVSSSSEYSDDGKQVSSDSKSSTQPVDLIISNLDPTINLQELKNLVISILKDFVMVMNLNITNAVDGSFAFNLKVGSPQEAQFAIYQLHRRKLGCKRVTVSYAQNNAVDPDVLRPVVMSLLNEVPSKSMPLFQFMELLESRCHRAVSIADVSKLREVCKICDNLGSRIISLTEDSKALPPQNFNPTLVPYCMIHCPNGFQSEGWCELDTVELPNVNIPLKVFSNKLKKLIGLHMGIMPFMSFQSCYEQVFYEALPTDDNGVQLEHLISCVSNIKIKMIGPNQNVKVIKMEEKTTEVDEESVLKDVPPSLAPNIQLLCREIVDLLKTTDRCQMAVTKFIPAYHHHFGRQCRLADYGYTRLLDLFENVSHVVQIMGTGSSKIITLTHSTQMRRFTSDLLRVLKVQPCKQILVVDFPAAYEKVMNKQFSAVEYGLCRIDDLIEEVIPEKVIVIKATKEGTMVAIPKKEQTPEEIQKTKRFIEEVLDLLGQSRHCRMLFTRFVPAYHHHFGFQCRVADYGFTKLIDLFEAIPDVVKIEELSNGEKVVCLTLNYSLKILGSQLLQLIGKSKNNSILLDDFSPLYAKEFGYVLRPHYYECDCIRQLMEKLAAYVKVVPSSGGPLLVPAEADPIQSLKVRIWAVLLNPPYCKDIANFMSDYHARYNTPITLQNLQLVRNIISISVSNGVKHITLTAIFVLAAQIYRVLFNNGGVALYDDLEALLFQCYGRKIQLADYYIYSLTDLANCFNFLIIAKEIKEKRTITLNPSLTNYLVPMPLNFNGVQQGEDEAADAWPATMESPTTPINPSNFWIDLPLDEHPKFMGDPFELISPAKNLLDTAGRPWSLLHSLAAPAAMELPHPDKLIVKGENSDDSTDSGVNTRSPSFQENGFVIENRRKIRKVSNPQFLNFN